MLVLPKQINCRGTFGSPRDAFFFITHVGFLVRTLTYTTTTLVHVEINTLNHIYIHRINV